MIWIVLLLVVVPAILFFRGLGRANGWIYDTFNEFFRESLRGHTHRGSLSRVLALLSSVLVVIAIIALILFLT